MTMTATTATTTATPCAGCPSPILAGAIGECVAGDGPARSTDPEGRVRHPTCGVVA